MSETRRDPEHLPADNKVQPWLRVHEVLLAFDPADDNEVAFAHALRLASFAGARLSLMCLRREEGPAGTDLYPDVRGTLKRWGLPGARDIEIRHLQVGVEDPVKGCARFLERNPTDLIVVAARQHEGRMTWLRRPAGEALASRSGEMTLYVPQGARGFVAPDSGAMSLRSILVPIALQPPPEPAVEAARRLMIPVPQGSGTATLLHVGATAALPEVTLPQVPGWTWQKVCLEGDVVERIVETAASVSAGLIAMTTAGRHGFLGVFRSSTAESVLRRTRCPLLCMPEGSFLG